MRITPTEHETQNAIMDLLAAEGIFAFRLNSAAVKVGKRFFKAHSLGNGAADILAFYDHGECARCGRIITPVWIEVKSSVGVQSLEQASFQKHVESKGHKYILARSVEDVRKALED